MPQRGTGDPLLKGADWEAVKAHWRRMRWPCARCGGGIDYDGPPGPRSLDVGHIVSRDQARAMGWSRAQINDIGNTQPECRTCSRSHGARYGNLKRGQGAQWGRPVAADEW